MPKLTFHGHATFSIETADGAKLVIDPFFNDNPSFSGSVDDIEADYILITHGHYDHVADLMVLAERTGATCIATFEIASFLESHGLSASPQHIGGGVQYPFGYVKLTPALHGGMVALPGAESFSTFPAGLLINFVSGERFHHAGDTGLITDMKLLNGKVDVAVLPIGDRFTMGPDDAVTAVDFIRPKVVIPCHYDTWPPIEQDAHAFAEMVGDRAQVQVIAPGDTYDF